MPQSSRIPTPIKQHWYRFRLGALPVISFLLCVLFVLTLWERQAYNGSFVGEVRADRLDVIADMSGELAFADAPQWQLYQPVKQGQLIAQLDDRETLARFQTVQLEAKKLAADLEAARSNLQLQEITAEQRHYQEWLRLKLDYEQKRIDYLQILAQDELDKATLRQLEANIRGLQRVATLGPNVNLLELQREAAILSDRIQGAEAQKKRREYADQVIEAKRRLDEYPESVKLPTVDSILAPIEAGIAVQQSIIEEVKLELEKLRITAPIDGLISAIHRRPGQRVVAGDAIVTISSSDMKYVLSYVRDWNRAELRPGMEVRLRLRQPGSPEFVTNVEEVGPHVEPVPPHQLVDQNTMEWATPIKIRIPEGLRREPIRPGELLNVILREPGSSRTR